MENKIAPLRPSLILLFHIYFSYFINYLIIYLLKACETETSETKQTVENISHVKASYSIMWYIIIIKYDAKATACFRFNYKMYP